MDSLIATVRDTNLKLMLSFGIGLHHAGIHERDRKTVEELFVNQKIQVCLCAYKNVVKSMPIPDTFCVFNSETQAMAFFEYINSEHPNIKFTMEKKWRRNYLF